MTRRVLSPLVEAADESTSRLVANPGFFRPQERHEAVRQMLRGELEEHAVVVRWSRFKSTVMKLSAIPGKEVYPHRDIAPVIKELTEAYGPARQIYGGGFGSGATGESYRQARERAAGYLSFLATGDRAKVLGGTAARLFQLVR